MYEIFYQLLTDRYPQEFKFETENDMYAHWAIWVSGDDYHFCQFYHYSREYTPWWMK